MSVETIRQIEFLGGPLDGHHGRFVGPRKPFVAIKTPAVVHEEGFLPVFFRVLLFREHLHARVLAIYELQSRQDERCYVYVGSYSEAQVDLDSEFVDASTVA